MVGPHYKKHQLSCYLQLYIYYTITIYYTFIILPTYTVSQTRIGVLYIA